MSSTALPAVRLLDRGLEVSSSGDDAGRSRLKSPRFVEHCARVGAVRCRLAAQGAIGIPAALTADLARHDALQAADDLPLGLSSMVRRRMVSSRVVGLSTHSHLAVAGGLGLAMPAAVQPVPAGLAARGRPWAGAAALGKASVEVDRSGSRR